MRAKLARLLSADLGAPLTDAASITTNAVKTATGWRLSGGKHFISDGEWSDFYLVSAKTADKEISLFSRTCKTQQLNKHGD